MSMEQFAVIISFSALLVAVYGILERHRAAISAIRVRAIELLGTIEELNVEQLSYEAEHPDDPTTNVPQSQAPLQAFAGRRALLSYQALSLVTKLMSSRFGRLDPITAGEHGSLAFSLQWCGDLDEARRQWELALSTKAFTPYIVRAASYRGLASTLCDLGDQDTMRETYQKALALHAELSTVAQRSKYQIYIDWLDHEMDSAHGTPEVPARGAAAMLEEPAIRKDPVLYASLLPLTNQLRAAAHKDIFVQSRNEFREVSLDDLLKHSMDDLLSGKGQDES
jgi:hypothetical protein